MQKLTDAELLREYVATHSEFAFGEIVRRYADAVYSAAMRQVGNEAQARDVAQTVFVDLARKAASLRANIVLIGWLHRGARLAALELLRSEQRRTNRERQAMELHDSSSETEGDWNAIRPVLDEAIANLGDEERNALLLRFFKNESLSSVGATLGVSEDAAQKRVSRALSKLRDFLAERGIKTTAAALSITLAANTIQSAPSGFAVSLAAGALTKAAVTGSSTTSFLTLSNMKIAFLTLALVGSIAITAVTRVQSQRSLREAQALAQQRAEEIDALRATNNQLARKAQELDSAHGERAETLRLRGEVTRLRRDLADLKRPGSPPAAANKAPNTPTSPQPQQINIKAKFISVPAGHAVGVLAGNLTDSQAQTIWQTLEQIDDARLLSEAQVTTLSGGQAQLQILPDDTQTNAPTFTLDVLPICPTNSRTIQLQLSIKSETSVRLSAEDSPMNISTEARDSQMMSPPTFITITDGQSSLFSQRTAENRDLIVLLTTTLLDPAGNRLFSEDEQGSTAGESTDNLAPVFPGISPEPQKQ